MKIAKQTEHWPLFALILVALLSIGLLQWNYTHWKSDLEEEIAAIDNLTEARLSVTRSYLITEQFANNDPTQQPQYAFAYLDQAQNTIQSWRSGKSRLDWAIGRATESDPTLDQMLGRYLDLLAAFRQQASRSLESTQPLTAALTIDRRIAFSALEQQADQIEQYLYQQFTEHSKHRQQQHLITLVYWTIFLAALDITVFQSIRARHEATAALAASEERFRAQYKGIPVPTYTWQHQHADFVLRSYNDAAERLAPESMAAMVGSHASERYRDRPDILADFQSCVHDRQIIQREIQYNFHAPAPAKDLFVSYVFVPPDLVMVHAEDRTERNLLAAQLTQAQKMEGIGRLAGGIAHDFNNILTAISGYATLAFESLPDRNQARSDIHEIMRASDRAARLTSQLLAFARKQTLQASNIDLADLITSLAGLFRRVLPESIQLAVHTAAEHSVVWADPGQIEQVLLNLVLNARDAIGEGGKITIETTNIYLDELYTRQRIDIEAGPYVLLAVSDTGSGMSPEVQLRAFDPFFTTKGPNQGSGLGLAMCYGIVKQHKGHIAIYSESGHGTTVKIYLPRQQAAAEAPATQPISASPHGSETILFVEDDEQVRTVVFQMLSKLGYHVISASSGAEALALAQGYQPGQIDLLITDLVMPGMSGRELSAQIRLSDPQIKILFISGYSEVILSHHPSLGGDVALLSKPFSAADLAHKIRSLL
ncbi:response regulator [Chloroflexia bacterium SDU3-3]|nr:response regulator [Chloroflexia bacterium SDU3-3]